MPRHAIVRSLLLALPLLLLGAGEQGLGSLSLLPDPAAAVPAIGARHPALSPDGNLLAFDWRGDIWIVPVKGGEARRITVHLSHDAFPRWSPDGEEIAFSSNRHGNWDLFVVAVAGGTPERLTYHSDDDLIYDWSPDGQTLYFGSRRESRLQLVYAVPRSGGRPVRVTGDLAYSAAVSPDGRWLAYVRGYTNWWRKNYRGPASRDIWLRPLQGGESRLLVSWQGDDDRPHWGADGKSLYFQSEREDGVMNLYRQDLEFADGQGTASGPPVKITKLRGDGMQFMSLSRDGGRAAFESAGWIWAVATSGGQPEQVAIDCAGDDKENRFLHELKSRGATEYAFAPGEEQVAFAVEGEIFAALYKDGELKDPIRLTETDAREKDLAWLDENTLLYVSDRHGNDDIFRMESSDPDEARLGKSRYRKERRLTDSPETEGAPQVSPDAETVLYRKGLGFLWTMEPDGDKQALLVDEPKILHSDWSPDSRYVAYSVTTLANFEDIYIFDVPQGGEAVNVSNHPNDDFHPLWTEDGKRLAWASRTDDGYYSVKYLWLTKEEADKSRAEREREEEAEEEKEDEEDKDKKDEDEPVVVKIDWDDVSDRIRTVTTLRGYYWDYDQSPDGKHYALRTDLVEGMELWTVDWDGDNQRRLTQGGTDPDRLLWNEDSDKVRYLSGGKIFEIANEAEAKPENLSFEVELTVDAVARRVQKLNEAWRLLNDGFYDGNFHGVDWPAMREKYEPLAAEAVMYEDLKDILREMIGELNASHLGTWSGPSNAIGDDRTGLLGFTPDDEHQGPGVRVAAVLPRGPLDREGRRVLPGETILAIDGEVIETGVNHYPLLNHKAGKEVDLTVRNARGKERRITVEPRRSVWYLDYRAWQDWNRAMVDSLSGGRIGYLHMSAMGDRDWDRFVEDIFSQARGKEGLILDVRYNNGGSIHDRVLTFLSRRPYSYTTSRGKREGNFNALQRWDGPIVLLTNERSYSDGEIFPWGFKYLELGRIVGMPTFGAVIGTNNVPLIDGTVFRIPSSGWYRIEKDGSLGANLENGPVEPHVLVPDVPEENLRGRDAQLQRGIYECLDMLAE